MQVTHASDHLTSVSVGARKTEAFAIAETPEFFMVLSKSLYSNERLAVVREVLCNAWDAHIAAGRTGIPIQVTLTNEVLVIRDSGTGIAPDRIRENYCTYGGGSTKTHDGKQTGGFSLGSKSPFAYADHFEVTSWHEGTKTIYNMVKSSPDNNGLPGVQQILAVPTTETGLQVSVNINAKDSGTFVEYVKQVAMLGEMNVELNGTKLLTLPFSKCDEGFIAFEAGQANLGYGLYVRYGSVVYPVPQHETYQLHYEWLDQRLRKTAQYSGYAFGHKAFILQAPPHSISVTPSRESLAMTETTQVTLSKLLRDIRLKIEAQETTRTRKILVTALEQMWHPGRFRSVWGSAFLWGASFSKNSRDTHPVFKTTNDIIEASVYKQFGVSGSTVRQMAESLRLETLANSGMDRRGKLKSLHRFRQKFGPDLDHRWIGRELIGPIMAKLLAEPGMDPNQLMAVLQADGYGGEQVFPARKVTSHRYVNALGLARGHIVLSHSRVAVLERAHLFPTFQYYLGEVANSLVYLVPRKAGAMEKAREFFTRMGFLVIDVTALAPGEKPEVKVKKERVIKPKRLGYPLLSSLVDEEKAFTLAKLDEPDLKTSENPEFFFRVTPAQRVNYEYSIDGLNLSLSSWVASNWGDRGVVIESLAHQEKLLAAGAVDFTTFLKKQVEKAFKSSKALRTWIEHRVGLGRYDRTLNLNHHDLVDMILNDKTLLGKLGLNVILTADERCVLKLARWLASNHNRTLPTYLEEAFGLKFSASKKSSKLVETIKKSKRVELIAWGAMYSRTIDTAQAQVLRDLILFSLKG